MTTSALAMAAAGLLLTFAPQEALTFAGSIPSFLSVLIVQAVGALYLGFAMLNWMAKDNLIGGIYSRPVALANFAHFAIMAITSLRTLAVHHPPILLIATVVYVAFAAWFGLIVFGNPSTPI